MDLNVSKESSWIVSYGSLEDTLMFRSSEETLSQTQLDQESRPIQLIPSPQSSVPCEVTLKFEGNLCSIEDISVRSTARVIEIYHKTDFFSDNEYILTARGELSMDYINTYKSRAEKNLDSDTTFVDHGSQSTSLQSSLVSEITQIREPQECVNAHKHNMESTHNLSATSNERKGLMESNTLQNAASEELTRNGSSCSDEDSWEEVKSSESCDLKSFGDSGESSQLQSPTQINKPIVKREQANSSISKGKSFEESPDTNVNEALTEQDFDLKSPSRDASKTQMDPILVERDSNKTSSTLQINSSKQNLYEVNVTLNSQPCASITIRLLSLQDKSAVGIDKICLSGIPVSTVKPEIDPTSNMSANTHRMPFGASLFAMLVPNMMQMSRSGLTRQHNVSFDMDKDNSSLCATQKKADMFGVSTSTGNLQLLETNGVASKGEKISNDAPLSDASAVLPLESKSPGSVLNQFHQQNAENAGGKKLHDSKSLTGCTVSNSKPMNHIDICQVKIESDAENLFESKSRSAEYLSSDKYECYSKGNDELLQTNNEKNPLSERTKNVFEHMFNRMERIENLCLRIEDHLCRSLNNIEKRLQIIESHCMMAEKPIPEENENVTKDPHLSLLSDDSSFHSFVSPLERAGTDISKGPAILSSDALAAMAHENCEVVDEEKALCPGNLASCSAEVRKEKVSLGLSTKHVTVEQSENADSHDNLRETVNVEKNPPYEELLGETENSASDSNLSIIHQTDSPKDPGFVLEEALVSALSAFSTSITSMQHETEVSYVEMPSGTLKTHDETDKNACKKLVPDFEEADKNVCNQIVSDFYSDTFSAPVTPIQDEIEGSCAGISSTILKAGDVSDKNLSSQLVSYSCLDTPSLSINPTQHVAQGFCAEIPSSTLNKSDATDQNLSSDIVSNSHLDTISVPVTPIQYETEGSYADIPCSTLKTQDVADKSISQLVSDLHFERSQSSEIENMIDESNFFENTWFNVEGPQYRSQESIDSIAFDLLQGSEDGNRWLCKENTICKVDGSTFFPTNKENRHHEYTRDGITGLLNNAENNLILFENEADLLSTKGASNILTQNRHTLNEVHVFLDVQDGYETFSPSNKCLDVSEVEEDPNINAEENFSDVRCLLKYESKSCSRKPIPNFMEVQGNHGDKDMDIFVECGNKDVKEIGTDLSPKTDLASITCSASELNPDSLICGQNSGNDGKNISFQEPLLECHPNSYKSKTINGLFFVEDEGLGEFIEPSLSNALCSGSAQNNSNESFTNKFSYGFESLI